MEHPFRLDRQLGRDEDPVPDADVLAHLVLLLRRERRRLLQDHVRDADLADVVEQAGDAEPLEPVPVDAEPLAALADACRTQSVGARTPVEAVWRWTERQLGAVDAVVVSLPPDDTVFGWDYPWLRDRLRARAIPHCCLYGGPHLPPTSAEHARLHALVAGATRVHEASHG